jgi:hypothetical protein
VKRNTCQQTAAKILTTFVNDNNRVNNISYEGICQDPEKPSEISNFSSFV